MSHLVAFSWLQGSVPTHAGVLVPKTHTFSGNKTRRSSFIAQGIVVKIYLLSSLT